MAMTTDDLFALQRKRAIEDSNAQGQTENDAIQRRFAAQGGLNSGSYIKAQEVQQDSALKRRQTALEGVDMAQAQDQAQKDAVKQQQQFTTSERQGGQEFAAGQAGQQRAFTTQERMGGQEFAAGQAGQQRQFQTGERLGSQAFTSGERQGTQSFAAGQQEKQNVFTAGQAENQQTFQRRMQTEQLSVQQAIENKKNALAQRGLDLEADAQQFNKGIALIEADFNKQTVANAGFFNGGSGAGKPVNFGALISAGNPVQRSGNSSNNTAMLTSPFNKAYNNY